jgi:hypothetical protein
MPVYRYTIVQLKTLLNVDGHVVKITVATFIIASGVPCVSFQATCVQNVSSILEFCKVVNVF